VMQEIVKISGTSRQCQAIRRQKGQVTSRG
jgi:hypothetical protein